MILIVLALVAVATVPLTGADIRRMAHVPIRYVWTVWVAIGLQTVLVSTGWHPTPGLGSALHLATYGLAATFAWANRRLPGVVVISAGGLLNLIAIAANGGVMPASESAMRRAGLLSGTDFTNSGVVEHARVAWLGDVFSIPASWPLSNVFSVGDVVVVLGIGYLAHRWCRGATDSHLPPTLRAATVADSAGSPLPR